MEKELKVRMSQLATLVEVLSNAATVAEEANAHCDTEKQVFTPQMLKGLNEFIYSTIWATRDVVRELKQLTDTQE